MISRMQRSAGASCFIELKPSEFNPVSVNALVEQIFEAARRASSKSIAWCLAFQMPGISVVSQLRWFSKARFIVRLLEKSLSGWPAMWK